MSLLSPSRQINSLRLWRARRGWVGVDIGTSTIKLAQVERVDDRLRFAARWLIEVASSPNDETQDNPLVGVVPQLKSARAMFRGSAAAAALSLSLSELRSFEFPCSTRDEIDCMIQEELQAECDAAAEDLSFDAWQCGRQTAAGSGTDQVSVITLPKLLAAELVQNLHSARLDCRLLDGLPCSLARATTLTGDDCSQNPVLAIDLGASSTTLVLVRNGLPIYSRQLRGCGLKSFLKLLEERLELKPAEAEHVLFRIGLATSASQDATHATHQIIAEPLSRLVAEIRRTLAFVDQRLRGSAPQELILFGGGAAMPQLPSALQADTGLPTRVWSLTPTEISTPPDSIFGVAAALSALAWEEGTCT